jgi:hypothetical protein
LAEALVDVVIPKARLLDPLVLGASALRQALVASVVVQPLAVASAAVAAALEVIVVVSVAATAVVVVVAEGTVVAEAE